MLENSTTLPNKDIEQEKIRILQHNCARSKFIIELCLQSAIGTTNIVPIQEL